MRRIHWEEIIESDTQSIYLIGYGSILNSITHEGNTTQHHTVLVEGFQRIYNLKMVPEGLCPIKLEAFAKKYWTKYGIVSMEDVWKIAEKKYCVLNSIYTGNKEDILSGVLIEIQKKDFEIYRLREEIYDLYETPYCIINPLSGEIESCHKTGYILSAQEQYVIDDGYAFLPYHTLAREGAYSFGEYFGKLFDTTTLRVQK